MEEDDDALVDFTDGNTKGEEIREQDRYLPVANIARIMKKILPNNAKITKDSKEAIQECVSEFISFITSEASDKCQQEKRKTINGDDLLWAMSTLGFDKYAEPLKVYLSKYREAVKGEKPEKKTTTTVKKIDTPNNINNSINNLNNSISASSGTNSNIYNNPYQQPHYATTTTTTTTSNEIKVYSYESNGQTIYYTTTNEGTNVQVYKQPDGSYVQYQYVQYQEPTPSTTTTSAAITTANTSSYQRDEQYSTVNDSISGTKRSQYDADLNNNNDSKASKV